MDRSFKNFRAANVFLGLLLLGTSAVSAMSLGNLPLWFEARPSPAADGTRFVARNTGAEFLISPAGVQFVLQKTGGSAATGTMRLVGANTGAAIVGSAELAGKINYLTGNDPAQWQTGVATFGQVRVDGVYPGINVVYYGNGRQLEYDFQVAAGANPGQIALRFDGAEKLSINPQGELVVSLAGGEIIQHAPEVYQIAGLARRAIGGGYRLLDAHTAAFALKSYDHHLPLVIDPVLSYSTYLGGSASQSAFSVAVDPYGNIYVAGTTLSPNYTNNIPWATTNAYQTNYQGGAVTGDAFVAKFGAFATNLVYLTYLGGSGEDGADGVAVDNLGNVYVGGYTSSTNFPTANIQPGSGLATNLSGSFLIGYGYRTDGFVTELNTNGSALVYSGLLGGTASDGVMGIAVDPDSGAAYVTGYTYSTNYPCTAGAVQRKLACPYADGVSANAFVSAIAPGGTNLIYSSYLGGTNGGPDLIDSGTSIAFNNGMVFVAGYTSSTNFPTTNGIPACQFLNGSTSQPNIGSDAFVAAFRNVAGTNLTLLYSTFLGGTNNDQANGIAADASGNAYVVGATLSTNFPYASAFAGLGTNPPSFLLTNHTGYVLITNAFLTQVRWNGTNAAIGFSAVFGGAGADVANGVALDASGNIYVVGSASSTNFPVTTNLWNALQMTNAGNSDVFVAAFTNTAGTNVNFLYSTYLGSALNDYGYGIATDPLGDAYVVGQIAYVVGQTYPLNFPTANNPAQPNFNGTNDAFLAILAQTTNTTPALVIAPASPDISLKWQMFPANYAVESSPTLTDPSWQTVAGTPAYSNGWYLVTLPATNAVQFFRLHRH